MDGASLGNEFSTAVIAFHEAIGRRLGVSAADHKALGHIGRHGPLTAGELAAAVGLSPGAATALVDRLESRGYVERVRDAADRRRTLIRARDMPDLSAVFADLQREAAAATEGFSAEQWQTITEYLRIMTGVLRRQTTHLNDSPGSAT
ncbi:MarR family winged helix-turn-helix transcriptional regulator [Myceligenerans pegani]|uniref:MarR family transcriptional regulator n=1 Tax=Myceligenerans pegani TaxID=2776917 RepID=A0ABR9MWD3_9MICO|nr:MarR family transcriptional regulator [Myceligenerans sp. TRM 65318]MBE1875425.1 MarR family transcriptional regulator [Myceligenerans sp. TRM 65318]MBE3017696.1 MarR family transcriptional regulator [Myceligenerans sp. TRM 65318]